MAEVLSGASVHRQIEKTLTMGALSPLFVVRY